MVKFEHFFKMPLFFDRLSVFPKMSGLKTILRLYPDDKHLAFHKYLFKKFLVQSIYSITYVEFIINNVSISLGGRIVLNTNMCGPRILQSF